MVPIGEDARFSIGIDWEIGMKPLALAFGVLILGDDLFVQIPEQAGFAFKAGRGRDKPNRVFTGWNRG